MNQAELILHSHGEGGSQDDDLFTFRLTMPRWMLAEFNTHRCLSRSAESSRAISLERRIASCANNPYIPEEFGVEQRGMQYSQLVSVEQEKESIQTWLSARDMALVYASQFADLQIHKQIANRVLEPYIWVRTITTGTRVAWNSLLRRRLHSEAAPPFFHLAGLIYLVLQNPQNFGPSQIIQKGDFHNPYSLNHLDIETNLKHSVACCGRVSYGNDAAEFNEIGDRILYDKLLGNGHWGPFEHQAQWNPIYFDALTHWSEVVDTLNTGRNFGPNWHQYRAMVDKNEAPYDLEKAFDVWKEKFGGQLV